MGQGGTGARRRARGARESGLRETPSKKVAVVRLDALGDTLLSTPAIDALCREYGSGQILVLCSQGLGEIMGGGLSCREFSATEPGEKIAEAIDDFGAETVYVFSEKKRALKGAYLSGAKERIGFDPGWTQPLRSLEVRRLLTVRFPIVNSLDSSSRYHEVERYCRLVAKGLSKKSVNGGRLKFFGMERMSVAQRGCGPVAFQWAKKWLQGSWPRDLLSSLVEALPASAKIFVGPTELEDARASLTSERREHLVCCESLRGYAKELGSCRYLISVDTGAVHVAAAMGVPVLDVFPEEGSHHTVPRWRPWMTPHRFVLKPEYSGGVDDLRALLKDIKESERELRDILAL